MNLNASRAYWDSVAGEKTFQYQLRTDWLNAHVRGRDVLDCGCWYGRLLSELVRVGYLGAVGMDFSAGMLARCVASNPDLACRLVQADSRSLPFHDRCFDAAIVFTLLTSMPHDSEQQALMGEIRRVLRPGGVVYISDLLLNSDARNLERYDQFATEFGTFGIFQLPEGIVVRHHSEQWIRMLTEGFTTLKCERFTVTTMNGNKSVAFQYLGSLGLPV